MARLRGLTPIDRFTAVRRNMPPLCKAAKTARGALGISRARVVGVVDGGGGSVRVVLESLGGDDGVVGSLLPALRGIMGAPVRWNHDGKPVMSSVEKSDDGPGGGGFRSGQSNIRCLGLDRK